MPWTKEPKHKVCKYCGYTVSQVQRMNEHGDWVWFYVEHEDCKQLVPFKNRLKLTPQQIDRIVEFCYGE